MPVTESTDCDLVFYTNPMSRGRIVRWMLEETGASYRQELLTYNQSMKSPDYLAINPMGKVPAVTHRGQVVTECAAICAYLADAFPEAALAPEPASRAAYYRWLFFAAGPLEAAIVNQALGVTVSPEKTRMVGYGTFEQTIEVLASLLADTYHIAGDRFTAADVYVGSQIMWGMQFGTIAPRPEFERYAARLKNRPALLEAQSIDDELVQDSME